MYHSKLDQVMQNIIPESSRDMFKNLGNLQDFIRTKVVCQVTKFLQSYIMQPIWS